MAEGGNDLRDAIKKERMSFLEEAKDLITNCSQI